MASSAVTRIGHYSAFWLIGVGLLAAFSGCAPSHSDEPIVVFSSVTYRINEMEVTLWQREPARLAEPDDSPEFIISYLEDGVTVISVEHQPFPERETLKISVSEMQLAGDSDMVSVIGGDMLPAALIMGLVTGDVLSEASGPVYLKLFAGDYTTLRDRLATGGSSSFNLRATDYGFFSGTVHLADRVAE